MTTRALEAGARARPVSYEMRRVLKIINKNPYATPRQCRTGTRTFVALSERGLIYVGTSFAAIAYPLTSAEATITDKGRAMIRAAAQEPSNASEDGRP